MERDISQNTMEADPPDGRDAELPDVAPGPENWRTIDQCVRAVRAVYKDGRARGLAKAASFSFCGTVLDLKPRQARAFLHGEWTVMSGRRLWPGIRQRYAAHLEQQAAHFRQKADALLEERNQLLAQVDDQNGGVR